MDKSTAIFIILVFFLVFFAGLGIGYNHGIRNPDYARIDYSFLGLTEEALPKLQKRCKDLAETKRMVDAMMPLIIATSPDKKESGQSSE